ncbi:MAG: HAD family phosphatase [Deltaproteobacteria bacterium]|nr:HAD family phosphatase [Deltaproteobacteria bacterium]
MDTSIQKDHAIDVVLFDFGGVLAEEGWKQGFRVIARANGLDGARLIQEASDVVYESGYILGKGSEMSFWNMLKRKTGIQGDRAAFRQEIVSRFILRNGMIALVKKLKSENLIVGILSDQTDILDQLNARFDFFKEFDFVFNSYHLGKGKRNISLFDDIAGFLKTPPERILFIDDDIGHVLRARNKGWNAIHYTDANSFYLEMGKFFTPQLLAGIPGINNPR